MKIPSINKLAFVDIDFTLSNHAAETSIPQLLNHTLANKVRKLLIDKGYLIIFASSRTEEMLMSAHEYELSVRKYHFERPVPHLGFNNGKRFYIPPEDYESTGILNPDIIISSTRGKIFVHQKEGGYAEDVNYRSSLPEPSLWRSQTMHILEKLNSDSHLFSFSPLESEKNYHKGITDVFPPDYRIQLDFQDRSNLVAFKEKLAVLAPNLYPINESWPEKNKYSLFICPKKGKQDAIHRVIEMFTSDQKEQITQLLFMGDSVSDLYGALCSIKNTTPPSTLFVVGGSRIAPYLIDPQKNDFAGDDIIPIKKNMQKISRGTYLYKKGQIKCTIIISDEKYPYLVGPESIIEYLS